MYLNKETQELVIKKLNNLYVLYRKKFLLLNKDGEYITLPTKDGNQNIKLSDSYIRNHLKNTYTVGVFAGTVFTKFVCFDVDVKDKELAKWTVYKLVNSLHEVGVPEEYIYVSHSGSKGYHVEIFFDKPIQNKDINQFYLLVLNYAGLLNIDYGEVELRPTGTQGVKIPLGQHFKTGDICWYCDYYKCLKPIVSYEYILNIQQLNTEEFYNILNRANDTLDITDEQAEVYENIIKKHKPLKIYEQNIDTEITIEAIEDLIANGITRQGTRHNSLLKIAKYNKHNGMSSQENTQYLIEWLSQQDIRNYSTKWEDALKDIDLIVKWTYENKGSLVIRKKSVQIDPKEIEELLKIKGKNDKLLLYSLLVHSKRYETKQGIFYMSYKQMEEVTGLHKDTVIEIVKRLENSNLIEVYRSNNIIYNNKTKKPLSDTNKYKINLLCRILSIPENGNVFNVCDKNCKGCLNACLCTMYSDKELKELLPRRQYEEVKDYRKYCTAAI